MVKSHSHYMDHKHYTDIMHGHGISDPGHIHGLARLVEGAGLQTSLNTQLSNFGIYENRGVVENHTTGISVNAIGENERWRLSTESRYIGNEDVNRQYTESNDANAIENRPKNYTVKIWKRTA